MTPSCQQWKSKFTGAIYMPSLTLWARAEAVASGKHINCLGVSSTYPEKLRDCRSNKKLQGWKDTRSKVYPGSVFLECSGMAPERLRLDMGILQRLLNHSKLLIK